jgi:hypothetical protein
MTIAEGLGLILAACVGLFGSWRLGLATADGSFLNRSLICSLLTVSGIGAVINGGAIITGIVMLFE